MILSRSGEYALLALLHLAEKPDRQPVRGAEIADALGVPANYLSKLLHQLARGGVLQSLRGPQGGFALAAPPDTLTLAAALEPIDAQRLERRCLLGRPECRDEDPCAAHSQWQDLSQHIQRFLNETTLESLLIERAPKIRRVSQKKARRTK